MVVFFCYVWVFVLCVRECVFNAKNSEHNFHFGWMDGRKNYAFYLENRRCCTSRNRNRSIIILFLYFLLCFVFYYANTTEQNTERIIKFASGEYISRCCCNITHNIQGERERDFIII
jgi:hypothetical protein